jgi:hypothetical protein
MEVRKINPIAAEKIVSSYTIQLVKDCDSLLINSSDHESTEISPQAIGFGRSLPAVAALSSYGAAGRRTAKRNPINPACPVIALATTGQSCLK